MILAAMVMAIALLAWVRAARAYRRAMDAREEMIQLSAELRAIIARQEGRRLEVVRDE
jgi:Tfp pilus assembly protein PilV